MMGNTSTYLSVLLGKRLADFPLIPQRVLLTVIIV